MRDIQTRNFVVTAGSVALIAVGFWLRLRADVPTTQPPTLLQQLSNETQQLYSHSTRSLVRVQLPTPTWLAQYNARLKLLNVWGPKLDTKVREQVMQEQDRALKEFHHPATSQAATTQISTEAGQLQITDIARPTEPALGLFAVGLLVDGNGHAVFPVFVDHDTLGDSAWPAVTGDGQVTIAKFVGSDSKTNLTVLQLEKHTGTPVALGHRRPEDGALTLAVARDGSAKLVVWNNQHPEPGFAILTDGSMAGFGFEGVFLGASTAKPVVDQLIQTGQVHRALLGVVTQEVAKEDPIRHQRELLGTNPAIRIVDVQENSAASRGDIQRGDLILKIGDEVVGDAPTFAAVIASKHGETTLSVLRGDRLIEKTVNLQPR